MTTCTVSYSKWHCPNFQFEDDLAAALEESQRDSERARQDEFDFEFAIEESKKMMMAPVTVESTTSTDVPVTHNRKLNLSIESDDLSKEIVTFFFCAEVCSMSANDVLLLAHLSEKFSEKVLMGPWNQAIVMPNMHIITDKLVTGSAFLAMKDIALFNLSTNEPHYQFYKTLFNEDENAWISAVLHANKIFGPFPNIEAWGHLYGDNVCAMPMARVQFADACLSRSTYRGFRV